jgi:hypothetical protein
MISVPAVDTPELSGHVTQEGDGVVALRLKGNADTRAMQPLDVMLKLLHAQVLEARIKEVVVDLRELEFMNSSCFKAFVSWLSDLQEVAPERQYRIRILSDSGKHWQRRSLGALSCFAVDLIRVETT